ncbi:MAG: DUF1592 domain-containing protein [Myxococcaceae bacterium]|nr:DUF1592 domain-containing protein [Myxococcaceae bacterium]
MRPLTLTALLLAACTADIMSPPGEPSRPSPNDPTKPDDPADPGVAFALPVCDPSAGPLATELHRLTREELGATLGDLLGAGVDLSTWLSQLPAEDFSRGAESFDNRYTQLHTEVLLELALGAAGKVTATNATLDTLLRAHVSCTTANVTDTCARDFIRSFGRRAWRRPLTTAEADAVFAAYQTGIDARDRFSVAVAVVLMAPETLYHLELGTSGQGSDARFALSPYEVASRLSYGVLGTAPTRELLAAAEAGALGTPAEVEAAAASLLSSPRARARTQEFFAWWLGTSNTPGIPTNPGFLAGLDTVGLRAEMSRELNQYLDWVVWTKRGSYAELLESNVSFARTPALAAIHGHALGADPNDATQVMEPGRKGLFLRGPLLTSPDDFTHPLPRGARLRTQVLCDVLGIPSPEAFAAQNEAQAPAAVREASARVRYDQKTSALQCAGCHQSINPLGFALEGFDSAGRQRDVEVAYDQVSREVLAEHPLDLSVKNARIDRTKGEHADGASALIGLIAHSEKGPLCMARQLHRFYALRSEDTQVEACRLLEVKRALETGSIVDGLRIHAARWAATEKVVAQ